MMRALLRNSPRWRTASKELTAKIIVRDGEMQEPSSEESPPRNNSRNGAFGERRGWAHVNHIPVYRGAVDLRGVAVDLC
jgi:hypothetical protein